MDINKLHIFVSSAPGIEPILAKECLELGLISTQEDQQRKSVETGEEPGGLLLEGNLEDLYRCNLHLRTASRVSVRLGEFYAAAFSELRKKAARLEWEHFLTPGQAVNITATCHKSKLYHSDAVAERILGAINDRFQAISASNKLNSSSKTGQLILVRLVNNLCTISIDSSGTPLHKRGYRQETAKAPLRETLAATLLLAAGWDGRQPLIDPFCGSGTIPIEAALLAGSIPPGIARDFAFMLWPGFDPSCWQTILSDARQKIVQPSVPIIGYDRDAGAIRIAASNAARAGQKDVISFKQQPISDLSPLTAEGWVITNPPYGVRIHSNRDLRDLYARFGSLLSEKFTNWQAGILCSEPGLIGNLNLADCRKEWRFVNGGIPVRFRVYSL